jgi:hypothetical protein
MVLTLIVSVLVRDDAEILSEFDATTAVIVEVTGVGAAGFTLTAKVIGETVSEVTRFPRFHTITCPATVEQSLPLEGLAGVDGVTLTGAGVPGTNEKHPLGNVTVSVTPIASRPSVTFAFPEVIVGVSVTDAVAPGFTSLAANSMTFRTDAMD